MRDKRLLTVALGAIILASLVLSQMAVAPSAVAKGPPAKITWSQKPVTATIAAGASFSTTVTFTSTQDISNVSLRLTPSFRGTTVVTPTTFAVITAGLPFTFEIDVNIPADTMRQQYNGTLTVRSGHKAFAQPLQLRWAVQK